MKKSESTIQQEIVLWSRKMAATGKIPELHLLHSNLTGANLSGRGFQWGVLVAEGALAGIPDLHLPVPSRPQWNSLYAELKTPVGKLSEAQIRVIALLEQYGNYVVVVRSLDEFKHAIAFYLKLNEIELYE